MTLYIYMYNVMSQRDGSPFVYRDRGGWPASLPYICKICVYVAIGTQSEIRLHERVPMVKIWGSSKMTKSDNVGVLINMYIPQHVHAHVHHNIILEVIMAILWNVQEHKAQSKCTTNMWHYSSYISDARDLLISVC